jgi:uncharacterized protein YdhG (YjbR/CyaY superfamily)
MKYEADSPESYIDQLSEERQEVIKKIRTIIKKNLPKGFEECINYNMIEYVVPHSTYPDGYHCDPKTPLPFMNVASQKNFVAIYHSGMYAKKEVYDWFVGEYPKHAKRKLDMGKSCVRFKKMDDIPFDLIRELCTKMTVNEWVNTYESIIKKK